MIKVDFSNTGIPVKDVQKYGEKVTKICEEFQANKNDEKEFLGWLELPTNYDKEEFERIKKAAKQIQSDSEILVVIGIGGSYLGARAVIEALSNTFANYGKQEMPRIIYAGNNMSPRYLRDLIDFISDKDK